MIRRFHKFNFSDFFLFNGHCLSMSFAPSIHKPPWNSSQIHLFLNLFCQMGFLRRSWSCFPFKSFIQEIVLKSQRSNIERKAESFCSLLIFILILTFMVRWCILGFELNRSGFTKSALIFIVFSLPIYLDNFTEKMNFIVLPSLELKPYHVSSFNSTSFTVNWYGKSEIHNLKYPGPDILNE